MHFQTPLETGKKTSTGDAWNSLTTIEHENRALNFRKITDPQTSS
jgi:hypothetical protein